MADWGSGSRTRYTAVLSEQQSSVAFEDEAIDLAVIEGQLLPCRVTHFESCEKFYVQLDMDKASLVEKAIANYDVNLLIPLTQDTITDGIHCAVKHEGKIYRAILNDTSDANNVVAVLPDYGNTVTTSLANLSILPTELRVYHYESQECCLNNYTPESYMIMPLEELKTALTGNKFIIYVNGVEGDRLVTVLYDISTGKQLSIFEPYLQGERLCARTVFNYNFGLCIVQHLQGLNEIYLQKMADIEKVQQLLGELYVFYDEGTPEPLEEFEPGTLCAVKSSDGNWYRAIIIIGINRDADVTVQFPDYGNKETVPKDKVKKLDPSFFEPCARALVAKLGLVPLRHDAVTELSKWTLDKEVQVTLVYEDGWLATLHLDGADLSMKLVNEKLATPEVSSEPVPLLSNAVLHFQMPDKVGKIEQIQAELAAAADTYQDLQTLELGTPCVAKHFADGLRYRARVLYPDNKNTAVRFIDYGNLVVFHKRRGLIKKMPESMYVTSCPPASGSRRSSTC